MNTVPEISVVELDGKLKRDEKFYLIDVRERWELNYAKMEDARLLVIPMSEMAQQRENVFPPDLRDPQAEIVVMCHHGVRSANVTAWMMQMGWKNVSSLAGGIDAYAREIDKTVGMY